MEIQISSIWQAINTLWFVGAGAFGLCVSGFFYIMRSKDRFEERIDGKVGEAIALLTEIKDSLIGTLEKKGLKTIVYELKHEVDEIKKIKD